MWLKSTEEEYSCVLEDDLSYSFIEFIKRQDVFYQDNEITTFSINTLWTGDADLCLYFTTVQDG
jgi:hypothetical protein